MEADNARPGAHSSKEGTPVTITLNLPEDIAKR